MTLTEIPTKVKHLVKDKNWNDTFIFEDMDCEHLPNAKEHLKVDCPKCNFDKRETWLENKLETMTGKETIKDKDGNIKSIATLKVIRGKFDDVIGIQTEFS